MPKYQIRFHPRLKIQLEQHAEFIARVSYPAAKRFRDELARLLQRLEENPYQFPFYDDPNLPPERYHKAIFAKWYKVVFYIEGKTVYVDAVVDGRADYRSLHP